MRRGGHGMERGATMPDRVQQLGEVIRRESLAVLTVTSGASEGAGFEFRTLAPSFHTGIAMFS